MSTARRIVIVGAGVAGSIFCHGLGGRSDAEIICLERAFAPDHAEAGTGLNIGPNAIKTLACHHPDLVDPILGQSLLWRNWRISLTSGRVLMDLPLLDVADNYGIRIRWSELYRLLRRPVLNRVQFGTEATAFRRAHPDQGGPIVVETLDRRTGKTGVIDQVELLVAADGRYSRVRETFLGRPRPRFPGICIYRLLVERAGTDLIDDYEQWFNGPSRLLAFRIPDAALYIAGSFPIPPDADVPPEAMTAAALRRCYVPTEGVLSEQCAYLVDAIAERCADIHWARMQEAPIAFCDSERRILLLGDAAHPMVPTLGQGATQAVEDACVAAAELRAALHADATSDGLAAAVARIEARRRPRAAFAAGFSREATDTMLAGADPVAGSLAKTQPAFRTKLARLYRDAPTA